MSCITEDLPVENVPHSSKGSSQPGTREKPRREVQGDHIHRLEREHGVDVEIHRLQIWLEQTPVPRLREPFWTDSLQTHKACLKFIVYHISLAVTLASSELKR